MLPVLLDLKFIKIYTFGVFLVLAFFWGCFLLWRDIRLTSYKEEEIFDGLFFSLMAAVFFSRLVYVLLNFSKFGFSFLKFILINGYPGFSLYGALLGGILGLFLYFIIKKINFIEAIDYFMSPFFLALTFGKLGSFFSGSEVGTETKFILSVKYAAYDGLRHLTPFYEALLFLLGVYLTYRILFEVRKKTYPEGFVWQISLWYLGLIYFLFDNLKVNRLYFRGLSFNKMVSLVILLTFSIYFVYHFRSFVFGVFSGSIHTLKSYGNKGFSKIREGFGRRTAQRGEESREADRGTKKK